MKEELPKLKNILYKFYRQKCYDELHKIIENIEFPYAIIKGEALSHQIYRNPHKRISSDIDILVSRNDVQHLEKLLENNGFHTTATSRSDRILMISHSHQVSPWCKPIEPWGVVNIDINFDIFWGEYKGKRTDIKHFLSNVYYVDIFGRKTKTLPLAQTLVQLILHHYKEMNSIYHLSTHNCINYNMFKDIYYLCKNNTEFFSKNKILELCTIYDISQYAYYIFYYTNQIFQDNYINEIVDVLKSHKGTELLNRYGLDESEQKVWKVDFWTRYNSESLFEYIKSDLTPEDMTKLERSRRIFG